MSVVKIFNYIHNTKPVPFMLEVCCGFELEEENVLGSWVEVCQSHFDGWEHPSVRC